MKQQNTPKNDSSSQGLRDKHILFSAIPTFTEYPPPIEILVYIEPTSIASNRQTIVANFFRKIVRRLVADSCIGNRFIDKNNIIQIKFYSNLIIGNTTILRSIDMPWVGNQSFAAFEQLLVDDYINNMISMEKMMNRTDSQPIHTNCNHDPELDSIMKNFILNGTDPDDGTDVRKRILVFTNVVYDCLSTQKMCDEPNDLSISDYLEKYQDNTIDYVYFNNDKFRQSFTADQLFLFLSPAFPSNQSSQNHLYFINSIDDIDSSFDDISFCLDTMQPKSLIKSRKYSKPINQTNENFWMFSSIAIIVFLMAIAIIVFILLCKHYRAKAIRKEFIRQIQINTYHQFDYIQTLWKVELENVQIDYDNIIGKGAQSIVYGGM